MYKYYKENKMLKIRLKNISDFQSIKGSISIFKQ